MSHGHHVPPIVRESNVSNAALCLLKLKGSMRADLSKELTDIVSLDMDLARGRSSRARRNAAARFTSGGDRGGNVVADAGAAAVLLDHVEVPEVDAAGGGAHGEQRVVPGRGEQVEVHVERDRVVSLELQEPLEAAAEGGARVAVLVRGGRELGPGRWVLRTEVLDRPEDDDVLVSGAREDVVAVERDTAATGG